MKFINVSCVICFFWTDVELFKLIEKHVLYYTVIYCTYMYTTHYVTVCYICIGTYLRYCHKCSSMSSLTGRQELLMGDSAVVSASRVEPWTHHDMQLNALASTGIIDFVAAVASCVNVGKTLRKALLQGESSEKKDGHGSRVSRN